MIVNAPLVMRVKTVATGDIVDALSCDLRIWKFRFLLDAWTIARYLKFNVRVDKSNGT
jgi:hypothetical protein